MPSPEQLLAYHLGELGPVEEERIGRLLVASPAAARRLLEVVELAEARPPAAGAGDPADFAAAAAWKRLSGELDRERAAPAPGRRAPSRAARRLAPLAATFGFLAAGAGWLQVAQMSGRVAELEKQLRQPVANLVTIELETARSGDRPNRAGCARRDPGTFPPPRGRGRLCAIRGRADRSGRPGGAGSGSGARPQPARPAGASCSGRRRADIHVVLFGCQHGRELQRSDFEIVPGSG